ncbi:MAG TPA: hypothetical protein DD727_08355 [Clostridiales bacterium]|nr:hypothetical protein [Clostridiales bacterium]
MNEKVVHLDETAAENAYNEILKMIISKSLYKGEKISETALVEKLNISRTPIRQALLRLSKEGLVEVKTKCYTKIADYSSEYIMQFGIVRVWLDIMSVKLAILNGSNAEFEVLEEICSQYEKAIEEKNIEEKNRLDCIFHKEITKIAKNEILMQFQDEMYQKVMFIMAYSDYDARDKMRSLNQHRKILKALKDRDPEEAVSHIKKHLYDFYGLTDKQTLF